MSPTAETNAEISLDEQLEHTRKEEVYLDARRDRITALIDEVKALQEAASAFTLPFNDEGRAAVKKVVEKICFTNMQFDGFEKHVDVLFKRRSERLRCLHLHFPSNEHQIDEVKRIADRQSREKLFEPVKLNWPAREELEELDN